MPLANETHGVDIVTLYALRYRFGCTNSHATHARRQPIEVFLGVSR